MAMQGMSGLDVAEQIRARQPWLPVVIITGYGSGAAQARAKAAGVSEFLHKPLSPEQLAGTADRVLRAKDSVTTVQPEAAAAAKVSPPPDVVSPASRLKNVALFLLAPFVGLGYILAFPVVGLGMLAWMAIQAQKKKSEASAGLQPTAPVKSSVLKTIGLMLAVPFIGLAFVIAGPIVGLGMLAWFGFHAWGKLGAKALAASQDIK
jgi:hypothetical protein